MGDSCCNTELNVAAMRARQKRVLIQVLAINVFSFVMMVGGSVASGSSALLSGTLDNLGDALTYALSLAVIGASTRAKAKVAFMKGLFISSAAVAVAAQIAWNSLNPSTPLVEPMGIVAMLNLAANGLCLWLLSPHRHTDINMSSVWECSRNDVFDGIAVIFATFAVWIFDSGWPDIIVATLLLVVFARSAFRVLSGAWREMRPASA